MNQNNECHKLEGWGQVVCRNEQVGRYIESQVVLSKCGGAPLLYILFRPRHAGKDEIHGPIMPVAVSGRNQGFGACRTRLSVQLFSCSL